MKSFCEEREKQRENNKRNALRPLYENNVETPSMEQIIDFNKRNRHKMSKRQQYVSLVNMTAITSLQNNKRIAKCAFFLS
jgi:hypothetical protein